MTGAPLTYDRAVEELEARRFDAVTSDVFDTLVWRPVASPHDVFVEIGRRLIAASALGSDADEHMLAADRRHAELRARERARLTHGEPECTLEEIWECAELTATTDWTNADLVELELDVERDFLRVHETGARLLAAARAAGCSITLVSDSYYSVPQLARLLEATGIDLSDVEVVTSSSRRLHKFGGLLDDVVAGLGGPRDRVLHIGDNPVADIQMARDAGVAACHVALDPELDTVANAAESWRRTSTVTATDGGRTAILRQTLVEAGTLATEPGFQFGAAVAGPIMVGFAGWAGTRAEELGATATHCLLREGARIAELIDIVRPESPQRVLIHASRWAILRALVFDGSSDELATVLDRRAPFTAEQVTQAFGCPLDDVRRLIGDRSYEGDSRFAAWDELSADEAIRCHIVDASARLRRHAITYLERNLVLDDGPLVLCDIGWGGRIQDGITTLLRGRGFDRPVHGLYSMLSPAGVSRIVGGQHLEGFLPTVGHLGSARRSAEVVIRNAEFLERVNTPPIGTLLEYSDDGSIVTRPDADEHHAPSLVAAQHGVTSFARTFTAMLRDEPELRSSWFAGVHAESALDGLSSTISAPDPRLAEQLTQWEHDDVAGGDAEPLANERARRWSRYANGPDTAAIEMNDQFWVAGGAAGEPVLAGQLAAVGFGIDEDAIAPPSPTGVARIAVFAHGSQLATAQVEGAPRVGPSGWMLLDFRSEISDLRSVRIDLGDVPLLADIGDVQVKYAIAGNAMLLIDGAEQVDRAAVVGGAHLGAGRVAVDRGGHLVVDVDPSDGVADGHVEVIIGFRTWPLDQSQFDALVPVWRRRRDAAMSLAGRVTRQLKQRLPVSST